MKNTVKKHMENFNKPKTFKDRKKAMKKGERKHKGSQKWEPFSFLGLTKFL